MKKLGIIRHILCAIAVFCLSSIGANAQRFAVNTDLVQWGIVSPNLGFEVSVAQHHALAFSASVAPFKLTEKASIRHLSIEPQYKYWFRMPFFGHYAGASMIYSSYDLTFGQKARTGNLVAATANYGYSMIIGRRWNLVPHLGVGVGVDCKEQPKFVPLVAKIGINIQLVVK